MRFLGLFVLIPLLVVSNYSFFLGKERTIFDPPSYTQRIGFIPSPRVVPIRFPVARPMPVQYPYPYSYPISNQYPIRKPIPVYVPYRPLPMVPNDRLDVISNIIGGFFPQRPNKRPEEIKQEESHEEEHGGGGHAHFGYDEDDGPETWPEKFPTCGGSAQSPIDIVYSQLEPMDFPTFIQENYWAQPNKMIVENNGHSIQVSGSWPKDRTPSIRGGPLKNTYEFKQMHIHWGMNDDSGSEHTVNGKKFPMELHVVHWNTKYGTYDNAASQSDGLAVVGYFFDIADIDNPMLQKFIRYTTKVEGKEAKEVKVSDPLPIGILDLACPKYVNYKGSLTTPPCSEVVTWMVCMKPLTLSSEQMQELRTTVKDEEHNDFHNFRPTQPLNGRPVYKNV